jgi:heterodisulfide reductase subunit C2
LIHPESQSITDATPLSEIPITNCYQCGKCTAGCPVAAHMDLVPNRLMRLVQMGRIPEALASNAIWQCVACQTCSARCPKKVDCAGVMDALRQMSVERGTIAPGQRRVVAFQRAFLDNVRRYGRLNELELIATFKREAFFAEPSLAFLFRGASLAPQLRKRRKLHLSTEKVRDRAVVDRIFARAGGKS